MTTIFRFDRALLGALLLCVAAGCGPDKAAFKNTDITGSDFGRRLNLTDHNGRERTLEDFRGKAVVVFFGFTHCPDVCPTTLAEMKAVRVKLGEDADKLQVLFVTLDPERDTPQLLREYVPAFDPGFLGLSGTPEQIAEAAKEFKVYFKKVPGATAGNYTVDHSTASYAYDPMGRLRLYMRAGAGPDNIAHDLRLLLQGA